MKKSSSAIALVLVSSLAMPLGCQRECPEKLPNGRPNPDCQGHHGGHGIMHGPIRGSGSSVKGTTSRGGFGGSAGAHAGASS